MADYASASNVLKWETIDIANSARDGSTRLLAMTRFAYWFHDAHSVTLLWLNNMSQMRIRFMLHVAQHFEARHLGIQVSDCF